MEPIVSTTAVIPVRGGASRVDHTAVARAVAGDDTPRLSPAERHLAILRLTSDRMSARRIAAQVRCSVSTVHRARRRARNVTTPLEDCNG